MAKGFDNTHDLVVRCVAHYILMSENLCKKGTELNQSISGESP